MTLISRLAKKLEENWPPIAIVLFILGLHWDLVVWAIPATGDHMIHLFKGWLMATHMIPSGRVTGWSNMAFTGYPAGVFYPILGDLLISAVRYLTFGLLSWERTYAISFLALLIAMPLSVYFVARQALGQIGALIAAVLYLGDVGGWPQGGHYSTVHWAVWPFALGLTLTMFSIPMCERVMRNPITEKPLVFLGFAVLLALSVLAHPMSAIFLLLSSPLFVVMYTISTRAKIPWTKNLLRPTFAALLGIALTLFWTIPWITAGSEWTHGWPSVGFGGLWFSLSDMFSKTLENELFKNFYWLTWILGLIGLVFALISRKLWPSFLAILLIITFVITGLSFELGDTIIGRKVQTERVAAFMKFIWFIMAGLTVQRIGEGLIWLQSYLPAPLREKKIFGVVFKTLRIVSGPALIVIIVIVGWQDSYGKVKKIGRLGGEIWENVVTAEEWLAKQPRGKLDRILYQPGRLCIQGDVATRSCDEVYHRHMFAAGPTRTNLPKVRFGYEATAIFKYLVLLHRWPADAYLIQRMILSPNVLTELHIRWIVSLVPWPLRDDYELVEKFGKVYIYSVPSGKNSPVRLEGSGEVKIEQFSDEKIVVQVSGADENSALYYPIAYFYPWHAYHNGSPLDIELWGVLPDLHRYMMKVPARNGTIELLYQRPWDERVAGWFSFATWILVICAAVFLFVRKRRSRS